MNSALPFFLLPLLPVAGALPEAVPSSSTNGAALNPPALLAPACPAPVETLPAETAPAPAPVQPAISPSSKAEPSAPAAPATVERTPCATAVSTTRDRQAPKIS